MDAAPRLELDLDHLRQMDFLHKAMFWAGLNLILGRLPGLLTECFAQVRRQLYEPDAHHGLVASSPAFPFRRALYQFDQVHWHSRYDRDAWSFRSPQKRYLPPKFVNHLGGLLPWHESDNGDVVSPTTRSDLIAFELMQRRQGISNSKGSSRCFPLTLPTPKDTSGDGRMEELKQASRSGEWILSDLLDLVKHLLEYGERCMQYQHAATDPKEEADPRRQEHVQNLTTELFSAVIRLVLALGQHKTDLVRLEQPVRLLTQLRLERIKQLDAVCERELGIKGSGACGHACAEANKSAESMVQELSTALAQHVEQVIADKLSVAQTGVSYWWN